MNISQAAKATNLSAKQIRDYEKAGLLPQVTRSFSGYRQYDNDDLARLRFIAHAREVGFSLAQIDTMIKLQNSGGVACEVKAITTAHIASLDEKIASLQRMRDILSAWNHNCGGDGQCFILAKLGDEWDGTHAQSLAKAI